MLMYNPPHPGEVVRGILIEGTGMSVTDAASILGVTRGAISKLINCHTGISPEMAVRLSIALNTSSEMWSNLQSHYDLSQAEHKRKKLIKQVSTLKSFKKSRLLKQLQSKKSIRSIEQRKAAG